MLPIVPYDFLEQIAQEHDLSPDQTDVFLRRFGHSKSYEAIAAELGTSPSACLKRMGNVYEKFDIKGRGRGKESLLRQRLLEASNTQEEWLLNSSKVEASKQTFQSPHLFNDPIEGLNDFCSDLERMERKDSLSSLEENPDLEQVVGKFVLDRFINILPGAINSLSHGSIKPLIGTLIKVCHQIQDEKTKQVKM
jgi:DNA-binding CsgD family transcriptional regulator